MNSRFKRTLRAIDVFMQYWGPIEQMVTAKGLIYPGVLRLPFITSMLIQLVYTGILAAVWLPFGIIWYTVKYTVIPPPIFEEDQDR